LNIRAWVKYGIVLGAFWVADFAYSQTPDEQFATAENTFRFQDYVGAEKLLSELLYPEVLLSSTADIIKAHEYLAACYYWLKNEKRLEEEFTVLLTLAPRHELDAFYYPSAFIEHFEQTKRRMAELHLIDPEIEPDDGPEVICEGREVSIERRSWVPNLVPFGVGQFINGQKTKGALFLSGQLLTLGMNIGAYASIEGLRGDDGLFSHNNAITARKLRIVQYVGLGAFGALVIWGIVDAFMNYEPYKRTFKVVPCPMLESSNAGIAICTTW
jgi:hypothetical protein